MRSRVFVEKEEIVKEDPHGHLLVWFTDKTGKPCCLNVANAEVIDSGFTMDDLTNDNYLTEVWPK